MEKKELKRGERVVWILWGETTLPKSISFPDAIRHDYKFYNTKAEAIAAMKRGGQFPVSHTHIGVRAGTVRRLRKQSHTDVDLRKNWNQPKKSKVQKLTQSAEQVDARRALEKKGIDCAYCGQKISKGAPYHVVGGKYVHALQCPHKAKRG